MRLLKSRRPKSSFSRRAVKVVTVKSQLVYPLLIHLTFYARGTDRLIRLPNNLFSTPFEQIWGSKPLANAIPSKPLVHLLQPRQKKERYQDSNLPFFHDWHYSLRGKLPSGCQHPTNKYTNFALLIYSLGGNSSTEERRKHWFFELYRKMITIPCL
jgi:hypothetical protein